MNKPKFQMQRRVESGEWLTIATFDNLDEAASALHPWSRIVPTEMPRPGRASVLLGIFIALIAGFSLGMIGQWAGRP